MIQGCAPSPLFLVFIYSSSKSKTKTSIADLYTNESKATLTDSDEAKANVLGNFFSSVFTIEPEDLLPELNLKDVPVINEIEINLAIVKKKSLTPC